MTVVKRLLLLGLCLATGAAIAQGYWGERKGEITTDTNSYAEFAFSRPEGV